MYGQTFVALQDDELGPFGLAWVGGALGLLPVGLVVYLRLGGPLPALGDGALGTLRSSLCLLAVFGVEALYGARLLALASGRVRDQGRIGLSISLFLLCILAAFGGLLGTLALIFGWMFRDMD